ncbi:MAG TPA: hypothetical protein VNN18_00455 [Candidatus Xenobia bacterium]|nr:hypothetical protein [Candidatus Xenobia bacterium]
MALVLGSSFAPEMRRQLAALSLRPGLAVFSGHLHSSRLSHYFLAVPLLRGETALFLDAANCFDPYRIVVLARKGRRFPLEVLSLIRVSRAFTCFQMAELIERTAMAARSYRARCIVLTGFPDIFDDEEISAAEAKSVFTRALSVLRGWRRQRLTALAFSDLVPQPTPLRAWLARRLAREAEAVYRFEETATGLALRPAKSRSLDFPVARQRAGFARDEAAVGR